MFLSHDKGTVFKYSSQTTVFHKYTLSDEFNESKLQVYIKETQQLIFIHCYTNLL